MYEIRQAQYEDIPRIMEFIRKYWSPNHIMGNDRTMFEFQHVDKREVYYILCENVENKELYGTLGYIPMSKWEWPIFSTTMIRSIENSECELPGEEMSKFLMTNKKCYNLISPGIEKRYGSVVRKMGGIVEKMNHYYRLNSRIKEYKIPIVNSRIIPSAYGRAHLREFFKNEDFREIFSTCSLFFMDLIRDFRLDNIYRNNITTKTNRTNSFHIHNRVQNFQSRHSLNVTKVWMKNCNKSQITNILHSKTIRKFIGFEQILSHRDASFFMITEKDT